MNILKRLWRGAGYVPGCGDHPGTIVMLVMTMCGTMAGYARDESWLDAVKFGALMFGIFTPFYLIGCWTRGGYYERRL